MAANKKHTHILIACMPKSGSSFISDIVSNISNFQRAIAIPFGMNREQELDEFYLIQIDQQNYVAQHHVRFSNWTAEMCKEYNIKPVVLIRDLFDVVVSLRDHIRRESHIWPMIWLQPDHAKLDDATLDRMIVRLAFPWFVQFYMSWREAPDALMVNYEELMADKIGVTKEILTFAGADVSDEEIAGAIKFVSDAGASRLNVGISGRGSTLDHDVVRAILELLDFYPEAATDPYFIALRARGNAILDGSTPQIGNARPNPRPVRTVLPDQAPVGRPVRRYLIRFGIPALLLVAAAIYFKVGRDLIPDSRPLGFADDAAVIAIAAFFAGRFTRYKDSVRNTHLRPDKKTVQKMLQRVNFNRR